MRPIEKYLEEVKKKASIGTDKDLAKRLGVKPSAICQIKNGTNTPSEEHCKKLAELAGDTVEKVLLLAQVSRASETSKPAWERILKFAAKGGLVLGLGVLYWAGYLSTDETTLPLLTSAVASTVYYVKSLLPVLVMLPVLMYSLRKTLHQPMLST